MKFGVLFSGGKDSTFATYLAKKANHELACLITVHSENPDSYMFHTPSIEKTKDQAKVMGIPLIVEKTSGVKEEELEDLERAIKKAKEDYGVKGIVTGAVESVYQATRVQKICDKLGLKCFNPLWQKDQIKLLKDLLENNFKVVITSVAAYPLGKSWLGREIDQKFIEEIKELNEKYKINPAGEGGEFETFVLDCPLFEKPLEIIDKEISGEKNSWRMEIGLE